MSNINYMKLSSKQHKQLQSILSKHFFPKTVFWNYDAFDKELYLVINNKEYIYSFPFFNELRNVDLAVDYNVFFAKIFGKEYIDYTRKELKLELKELDCDDLTKIKEYEYLKELNCALEKEYKKILLKDMGPLTK